MSRTFVAAALALALALATATTAHARVTAQPKTVNFGAVVVGFGSAPEPVFYTNTGSNAVVLTLPTFPDPAWFGSPTLADQPGLPGCSGFLGVDETCTMGYLFNPQGLGHDSTIVSMPWTDLSTAATGDARVRLAGRGVSP